MLGIKPLYEEEVLEVLQADQELGVSCGGAECSVFEFIKPEDQHIGKAGERLEFPLAQLAGNALGLVPARHSN